MSGLQSQKNQLLKEIEEEMAGLNQQAHKVLVKKWMQSLARQPISERELRTQLAYCSLLKKQVAALCARQIRSFDQPFNTFPRESALPQLLTYGTRKSKRVEAPKNVEECCPPSEHGFSEREPSEVENEPPVRAALDLSDELEQLQKSFNALQNTVLHTNVDMTISSDLSTNAPQSLAQPLTQSQLSHVNMSYDPGYDQSPARLNSVTDEDDAALGGDALQAPSEHQNLKLSIKESLAAQIFEEHQNNETVLQELKQDPLAKEYEKRLQEMDERLRQQEERIIKFVSL